MKSKLALYSVAVLFVVGAGVVFYQLAFDKESESKRSSASRDVSRTSEADRVGAKASTQGASDSSGISGSNGLTDSIWKDNRLSGGKVETRFGRDITETAKIESNLAELLELYQVKRSSAKMLQKLDELLEENPNVPEYVALKGDYLYNLGNYAEAEKYIQQLVELDPNNEYARTTLAEVTAIRGDYDSAMANLDEVLAQNPANRDAITGMITIAELQGDPDRAFNKIDSLLQENPNNAELSVIAAESKIARNRPDEAIEMLGETLRMDPRHAEARRGLALAYLMKGDAARAEAEGLKAYELAQDPQSKALAADVYSQSLMANQKFDELSKFQKRVAEDSRGLPK